MASTQVAAAPAAAPTKPGNTIGRMTGLTLFTPIRPQWAWFLKIGLVVTRHLPFMARHIRRQREGREIWNRR